MKKYEFHRFIHGMLILPKVLNFLFRKLGEFNYKIKIMSHRQELSSSFSFFSNCTLSNPLSLSTIYS